MGSNGWKVRAQASRHKYDQPQGEMEIAGGFVEQGYTAIMPHLRDPASVLKSWSQGETGKGKKNP